MIKRYHPWEDLLHGGIHLREDEEGDYIKYTDYAKLVEFLDKLEDKITTILSNTKTPEPIS